MGCWSFYCFLCAVGFDEYDMWEGDGITTELLPEGNMKWLNRLKIIGVNEDSPTLPRYYLSGLGFLGGMSLYGMATVTPGDNQHGLPFPELYSPDPDGNFEIYVYMDIDERTSGALPAHPECLQIFVKALVNACGDSTITRFEDVDLQRFFECLAPKREDWLSCLTLYYGPLMDENKHEQDFYLRPGMEPYVTNPMDVPALRNVLERASRPTGAPEISDIFPPGPVGNISTDPFNKLPPELIVEIMLYLPSNSLSKLTAASPTAYAATRSNWFWRRRLTVDMPWLWELSEPSYVPDKGVPDWKAVYQHLSKASFAPSETDPSLLGLANRGRIWGVCEQVLELYLGHQEPKKPAELEEHEVD